MSTLRRVAIGSLIGQVSAAGRAAVISEEIPALRCVPDVLAAHVIVESANLTGSVRNEASAEWWRSANVSRVVVGDLFYQIEE